MSKKHEGGLSLRMTYTYSLGDFCFTFFIQFIGYYLMFYLTDVIRFSPLVAASVYTIVQVFETVGVLLGGLVMDRTRLKGGKFRPWVFIGSTVCAVLLVFLFTRYRLGETCYMYVFMALYCFCYWGYNFMWVAFRALAGYVSKTQNDVMNLAIASQQAAVAASFIFSFVAVKLLYGFGSLETGFTVSSLVYGGIILVCMFIVGRACKPYDNDEIVARDSTKKEKATIRETLRCFTGPMLPFFISSVLRSSVSVAVPALMVYYFNYVLGSETGMTMYLSTVSVLQIVAVIVIKPLNMVFSKTTIYRATGILSFAAMVIAYFFGTNLIVFVGCMAFNNMMIVIAYASVNAFITDIADYNKYVRGMKTRGFTVSLSGTANTIASLVGGAIVSWSLVAIGYNADAAAAQSVGLAQNIRVLVTLGTGGLTLISLLPFMFYKLNGKEMEKVYALKNAALGKNSSPAPNPDVTG